MQDGATCHARHRQTETAAWGCDGEFLTCPDLPGLVSIDNVVVNHGHGGVVGQLVCRSLTCGRVAIAYSSYRTLGRCGYIIIIVSRVRMPPMLHIAGLLVIYPHIGTLGVELDVVRCIHATVAVLVVYGNGNL